MAPEQSQESGTVSKLRRGAEFHTGVWSGMRSNSAAGKLTFLGYLDASPLLCAGLRSPSKYKDQI